MSDTFQLIGTELLDNSTQLTLAQAILEVQERLRSLALNQELLAIATVAFDGEFDPDKLEEFSQQWGNRDFSGMSGIEIRPAADINFANGAFAASLDKIYLSQEFLAENEGNSGAIAKVIAEEMGHFLESQVKETDTVGDEGRHFAALVFGETVTESQLQQWRNEDDRVTVTLDGELVEIEQNNYTIRANTTGSYGDDGILPAVNDVPKAFDRASGSKNNRHKFSFKPNEYSVNGQKPDKYAGVFRDHIQSVARLSGKRGENFLVFTRNARDRNDAALYVARFNGIESDGDAFKWAASRTSEQANEFAYYKFYDVNHAGGVQALGSLVFVANDCDEGNSCQAYIQVLDLSDPFNLNIPDEDRYINRLYIGGDPNDPNDNGQGELDEIGSTRLIENLGVGPRTKVTSRAAAVAAVRLEDGHYLLFIRGREPDRSGWFYRSTTTDIKTTEWEYLDFWNEEDDLPDGTPWHPWETINFIPDKNGDIYMVGMGTRDNKSFLYRLTQTGTKADGKPNLNFEYIDGRGLNTSGVFIRTRFGAGTHITPNGNIVSYVTDRTPNPRIRIDEFRYHGRINGNNEDNRLTGGEEEDFIYGFAGNDIIDGNLGDDQIYGGSGNDSLEGNGGNDFIYGDEGNDTILGGEGNDTLDGRNGDDFVYGNQGNDIIYGDSGNDILDGREDNDTVYGWFGHDVLFGGQGEDLLSGENDNDLIFGFDGNDRVFGGQGNDSLHGENQDDYLEGNEGDDDIYGNDGQDTLIGGNNQDQLYGGNHNDILEGNDGNDTLWGQGGQDILFGGEDADQIHGGEDGDYIEGEGGEDKIYGDGGNDTVKGGLLNDGIHGGSGNDILEGNDGSDTISGGQHNDTISGGEGDDLLEGNHGNDTISGGQHNDTISGGEGNDLLEGNEGNDSIDGGDDNNILRGGVGNDTLNVSGSNGQNTLEGGDGEDKIYGGLNQDYIYGGEDKDYLFGNEGTDTIQGNQGDDEIEGNAGDDTIQGGEGKDTILGGTGKDIIYGNQDTDIIYGGYDKDEIYGNEGPDELHGNEGHDQIFGNDDSDEMYGEEGDDQLFGGKAGDTICGGENNDFLKGELGEDELYGGSHNDKLEGGDDGDQLYGEDGDDLLIGDDSNDLAFKDKSGNDTLDGGSGDDFLFGYLGDDILMGGEGDDWLEGGFNTVTLTLERGITPEIGFDNLYGGAGKDVFVLAPGSGTDFIKDFGLGYQIVDGERVDDLENRDVILLSNGLSYNFIRVEAYKENSNWTQIVDLDTGDILAVVEGINFRQLTRGYFDEENVPPNRLEFESKKPIYARSETVSLVDAVVRDANGITDLEIIDFWLQENGGNWEDIKDLGWKGIEGSVVWGDAENDGDLDVLLAGFNPNAGSYHTRIYLNNGDDSFTEAEIDLPESVLNGNGVTWGHYNNEGDLNTLDDDYLDILGFGFAIPNQSDLNELSFGEPVDLVPNLAELISEPNFVVWEDYDGDGNLDMLLTGWHAYEGVTYLYQGDGNGNFTEVASSKEDEETNANLTGGITGEASWFDYDNNGTKDLLVTGIGKVDKNDDEISIDESAQSNPAIAALPDGGFVAVWTSANLVGLQGQRFDAQGNTVGGIFDIPFDIPTETLIISQEDLSVTVLEGDKLLVTWRTFGTQYDLQEEVIFGVLGVYGRRFALDQDGVQPIDDEQFRIVTQEPVAVKALADGGFILALALENQLVGQRYDSNRQPVGTEFPIADRRGVNEFKSTITELTDDKFAVLWESSPPHALSFDGNDYVDLGNGIKLGNQFTQEAWIYPTSKDNNYHAFWGNQIHSQGRSPGLWIKGKKIYGGYTTLQALGTNWNQPENRADFMTEDVLDLNQWNHVAAVFDGEKYTVYVNGEKKAYINESGSLIGFESYNSNAIGLDSADIPVKFIGKNDNSFEGSIDEVRFWNVARSEGDIKDDLNRQLQGNEEGLVGYWNFDEGSGSTVYDRTSNNNDGTIQGAAWIQRSLDASNDNIDDNGQGIYGKLFEFDDIGNPVPVLDNEDEQTFLVNTSTQGNQFQPAVAALAEGGFVAAWTSENQDGSGFGIYAQRFDKFGNKVGEEEFLVNTTTEADQSEPTITALDDGGFIITWTSALQDGSGTGVYGQRFDALGRRVGREFQVNNTTDGAQSNEAIATLTDGSFVALWEDSATNRIAGQRFNLEDSKTKLYQQDSSGFTDITAQLPESLQNLSGEAIAWYEYDPDTNNRFLLVSGLDGNKGVSQLYQVDGAGNFIPMDVELEGAIAGDAVWTQYNDDEDEPLETFLLLTGASNEFRLRAEDRKFIRIPTTDVYRYDTETGQFQEIKTNLPEVYHQTKGEHLSWTDYDDDGDSDLLISGTDFFDNPTTKVYRNDGYGIIGNRWRQSAPDSLVMSGLAENSDIFVFNKDSGIETIIGFEDGIDLIYLPPGITFDPDDSNSLKFQVSGNQAEIRYQNEIIAQLEDIQPARDEDGNELEVVLNEEDLVVTLEESSEAIVENFDVGKDILYFRRGLNLNAIEIQAEGENTNIVHQESGEILAQLQGSSVIFLEAGIGNEKIVNDFDLQRDLFYFGEGIDPAFLSVRTNEGKLEIILPDPLDPDDLDQGDLLAQISPPEGYPLQEFLDVFTEKHFKEYFVVEQLNFVDAVFPYLPTDPEDTRLATFEYTFGLDEINRPEAGDPEAEPIDYVLKGTAYDHETASKERVLIPASGEPIKGSGDYVVLGSWIEQFGSSGYDISVGIATDAEGNLYLTGDTNDNLEGTNVGSNDVWVSKYDQDGNQVWLQQFGSSSSDYSLGIATDAEGNLYLTGSTTGNLEGTNVGGDDVWLAKYDKDGNQVWLQQFGSSNSDFSLGIAIDAEGDIYLTGGTLGNLEGTNVGGVDVWLAKYNKDGDQVWLQQFGSSSHDYSRGIAADAQGNIYLAGDTVGNLAGTNVGSDDVWLAKYDKNGNQVWLQQFGSSSSDFSQGITTDAEGDIYLTGYTTGNLEGTNAGRIDVWVAKYDQDGNQVWLQQFGSSSSDYSLGIATDAEGNLYLTGSTTGNLEGTNVGISNDAWVAKYDQDGNQVWLQQFGSSSSDFSWGITSDNQENLYLTGSTTGNLEGTNAGSSDAWVAKISQDGNFFDGVFDGEFHGKATFILGDPTGRFYGYGGHLDNRNQFSGKPALIHFQDTADDFIQLYGTVGQNHLQEFTVGSYQPTKTSLNLGGSLTLQDLIPDTLKAELEQSYPGHQATAILYSPDAEGWDIETGNQNNRATLIGSEVYLVGIVAGVGVVPSNGGTDEFGLKETTEAETGNVFFLTERHDFVEKTSFTINTHGEVFDETIEGKNERDHGQESNDILTGGDGNDLLISYYGSDYLDGGTGEDTLISTAVSLSNSEYLKTFSEKKAIWLDYNTDENLDILLPDNTIYRNNGDGSFTYIGEVAGVQYPDNVSGDEDFGDYDNDGNDDKLVTTILGSDERRFDIRRNDGQENFTIAEHIPLFNLTNELSPDQENLLNIELVSNGGAEIGDTSGWQENRIEVTETPITSDFPVNANLGNQSFYARSANPTRTDTLTQTIDISQLADFIDRGSIVSSFNSWLYFMPQGEYTGLETAEAILYFLDGNGELIQNSFNSVSFQDNNLEKTWEQFSDVHTLPAGTRQLQIELKASRSGGTSFDAYFDNVSVQLSLAENQLYGWEDNDLIWGGDFNDLIDGGEGDDYIQAGPGDDRIDPGQGRDLIDGSDGSDTITYEKHPGGVIVNLDAGDATDGYGDRDILVKQIDTFIPWSVEEGGNDHLYILTDSALSWEDAEKQAIALGGNLVTVNNLAEQQFIEQTFLSGDNDRSAYWIGFNDAASEGNFVWSSGEPVTYTNWNLNTNEPNDFNNNEDYAVLNFHHAIDPINFPKGTWNNFPGDGEYRGLIEIVHINDPYVTTIENVIGSEYPDTLQGNLRPNLLQGLAGPDLLIGAGNNDILQGGPGDDRIEGGSGDDLLESGGGADTLTDEDEESNDTYVFNYVNAEDAWMTPDDAFAALGGGHKQQRKVIHTRNGFEINLDTFRRWGFDAEYDKYEEFGLEVSVERKEQGLPYLRQSIIEWMSPEDAFVALGGGETEIVHPTTGEVIERETFVKWQENSQGWQKYQEFGLIISDKREDREQNWLGLTTGKSLGGSVIQDSGGDDTFVLPILNDFQGFRSFIPWSVEEGGNGHLYMLTNSALSWEDAEKQAIALGGHLVTVNNLAEQQFIEQTFLSGDNERSAYWIGFNDTVSEGNFVWSSGEPITYTNWNLNTGEPNDSNNDEDYGVLNFHHAIDPNNFQKGTWNDANSEIGKYQGLIEIVLSESELQQLILSRQRLYPGRMGLAQVHELMNDEHHFHLAIDLNQDGAIQSEDDLLIRDFFDSSANTVEEKPGYDIGSGLIETFDVDSVSNALSFDGGDDYVDVGSPTWHQGDFTWELWAFLRDDRDQMLINHGTGYGGNGAYLNWFENKIYLTAGTQQAYTKVNPFPLNTWAHIAAVKQGSNVKIYVNGEEQTDTSNFSSQQIDAPSGNMWVGKFSTGIQPVNGLIDEVRIWNVARSERDIKDNLNRQLEGNESELAGYWNFDEGSGDTVEDLTVNDNDGTIQGATWNTRITTNPFSGTDILPLVKPFTSISLEIPNFGETTDWTSSSDWGDYDADGYLDALVTGQDSQGKGFAKIYRNLRDDKFEPIVTIEGLERIQSTVWGDYNNDGDLDLLLVGHDLVADGGGSGDVVKEYFVKVYSNEGEDQFMVSQEISLGKDKPAIDADWGDYDNDGDLDIVIIQEESNTASTAILYRQNLSEGAIEFEEVSSTTLEGFTDGSVDWRDYDTNGELDLLLTGWDTPAEFTSVLSNLEQVAITKVYQVEEQVEENDSGEEIITELNSDEILVTGVHNSGVNISDRQFVSRVYHHNQINSDFSELQINGLATLISSDTILRLTQSQSNQYGSAFLKSPISLAQNTSFSTHFEFQLSSSGGISEDDGSGADGSGADGFAFVISNDPQVLGGGGGGLGYLGINPSFVVEFDTWKNGYDPNGNHLGINLNGDLTSVASTNITPRLNNGNIWHTWIDYIESLELLEIRVSSNTTRPEEAILSYKIDLAEFLNLDQAYFGFTAATAGAWNNHDILSWELETIDYSPELETFAPDDDIAWGDYNNDGNIDVLFTRKRDGQPVTDIYQGEGQGDFTLLKDDQFLITSIQQGEANWGDYDRDGDLDILLSGGAGRDSVPFAQVYRNNLSETGGTANQSPETPEKLNPTFADYDEINNTITLKWLPKQNSQTSQTNKADDVTPLNNLTYNLKVGTTPGGTEILSPASQGNGDRLIAQLGNVGYAETEQGTGRKQWTIRDLEPGKTYYWNVQAIDQNWQGSNFASSSEKYFTANFIDWSESLLFAGDPNPHPTENINWGNDVDEVIFVDWGDYDNDGQLEALLVGKNTDDYGLLRIYELDNGGQPVLITSQTLTNGTFNDAQWGYYNNDGYLDILVVGTKDSKNYSGIYESDRGKFDFAQLTTTIGLDGENYQLGRWGDVDNDGYLDVLLAGTDISKVYFINDGVIGENPEEIGLHDDPSQVLDAFWVDYDNDGDLDITLSLEYNNGKATEFYTTDLDLDNGSPEVNFSRVVTPLREGAVVGFDNYNNGGALDALVEKTIDNEITYDIHHNLIAKNNQKPTASIDLKAETYGTNVNLIWTPGSDQETSENGLSYNLRVSNGERDADGKLIWNVVSPLSLNNFDQGSLIHQNIPQDQAEKQINKHLHNLPEGIYYWQVQTVDTAFAGSDWSDTRSFVIGVEALDQSLTIQKTPILPELTISDLFIGEEQESAKLTVKLHITPESLTNLPAQATVEYQIIDQTTTDRDYTVEPQILTFDLNGITESTTETIEITPINDDEKENNETLWVTLNSANNAFIKDFQGIVTIIDDDNVELLPDFTAHNLIATPPPAANSNPSTTDATTTKLPWGREFTLSATINNTIDDANPLVPYYEVYLLTEEEYNNFNQDPHIFFSEENTPTRQNKIIAGDWANPASVSITNTNNSHSYSVVLNRKPTADVTINIDGTATTEQTSLTFTPDNWDQVQTVNITQANAGDTIAHTIDTSASEYQNIPVSDITFEQDGQNNLLLTINNPIPDYQFSQEQINVDTAIPIGVQEGNYRLLLAVDPDNTELETDETNNYLFSGEIEVISPTDDDGNVITIQDIYYEAIEGIELPDLAIVNPQITDTSSDGKQITIAWDIQNQGRSDLLDDISVEDPAFVTKIYLFDNADAHIPDDLIDSYLSGNVDSYESQLVTEELNSFDNIKLGDTISKVETITLDNPIKDDQYLILATFPLANLDAQLDNNIVNVTPVDDLPTVINPEVGNDQNNYLYGNSENNLLMGLGGIDVLFSYGGEDTLEGGDGHDQLNGGEGNDLLNGGEGNDTYVIDSVGDVVVEAVNQGSDRVVSSISYTLGNNLENLTLTGSAIQGVGNDQNNYLYGNSENNLLMGLGGIDVLFSYGGEDTLEGGDGHDQLNGGEGNDLLNGGEGNDVLIGGNGKDTLIGGSGKDILTGGNGEDIFQFMDISDSGDTITDFEVGIDQLDFTNLGVSSLDDFIITQNDTQTILTAKENDFSLTLNNIPLASNDVIWSMI